MKRPSWRIVVVALAVIAFGTAWVCKPKEILTELRRANVPMTVWHPVAKVVVLPKPIATGPSATAKPIPTGPSVPAKPISRGPFAPASLVDDIFEPNIPVYVVSIENEATLFKVLARSGYRSEEKQSSGMQDIFEFTTKVKFLPFLPFKSVRVVRMPYVHTKFQILSP